VPSTIAPDTRRLSRRGNWSVARALDKLHR